VASHFEGREEGKKKHFASTKNYKKTTKNYKKQKTPNLLSFSQKKKTKTTKQKTNDRLNFLCRIDILFLGCFK